MNRYYVYMYMTQDNYPFYIGMGYNRRYHPDRHTAGHTYSKIKSIGKENVKVRFLHRDLTQEDACYWERYWIKYFGRQDIGTGQLTNHTDGGDHPNHSKETKQKISETLKGKKHSEETKQKMREVAKDRANKGSDSCLSKFTKEQIRDIRQKYIPCKYTISKLAKEYNVGMTTIHNIVSQITYTIAPLNLSE